MIRSLFVAVLSLACFVPAAHAQDGWLLFRGNPQRTGEASSAAALPKLAAWQRPLLLDKRIDELDELDDDKAAKELIDKLRNGADPTILPGFFPIIVDGMCIYRNHRQVCSASLKDYTMKDDLTGGQEVFRPSQIVWKSIELNASLAVVANNSQRRLSITVAALQMAKQDRWLWANPLIGSIGSNGKTVFAVDDLVFSPIDGPLKFWARPGPRFTDNDLRAYQADTGRLHWDTGSPAARQRFDQICFLGAPLPVQGKLYVLHEKSENLRLSTMMIADPKIGLPEFATSADLMKIPAAEQIVKSPLRRTQPLHIAYADGLLVCPTHAGVLVGVDRAKMTVRWQYRYRSEKVAPPDLPHWQAACPIIVKDRIVFTAADAPEVHCIDLDGKKLWTAPADQDLYLATVHDDLVLLVGKTRCRALALSDGKEKWKLETGLPAGVGVKSGSLYYLPLKRDVQTNGPTLWAIDLAKGRKAHRLEVPYPDALGNLAFHRGQFVSQSVTHVAAFPLAVKKP